MRGPVARASRILIVAVATASCGSSTGSDGTGTNPTPPTPPAPTPTLVSLTVAGGGAGTGSGQVTSNVGGIACTVTNGVASGTCSATYSSGQVVQLQVAAGTLTGWAGDCTGASTCQVTMSANRQVTAAFLAVAAPILRTQDRRSPSSSPIVFSKPSSSTIRSRMAAAALSRRAVSNANPDSWVQLAIVGGSTLRATITATGLMPYSEDEIEVRRQRNGIGAGRDVPSR